MCCCLTLCSANVTVNVTIVVIYVSRSLALCSALITVNVTCIIVLVSLYSACCTANVTIHIACVVIRVCLRSTLCTADITINVTCICIYVIVTVCTTNLGSTGNNLLLALVRTYYTFNGDSISCLNLCCKSIEVKLVTVCINDSNGNVLVIVTPRSIN